MVAAFLAGAIAGYAIAIPVGAIAILIVEAGVQRGFPIAAAAGAGTATADFAYATLAMVGGAAIGPVIAPVSVPLRIAAVVGLLAIGLRGLRRIAMGRSPSSGSAAEVTAPDGPARASATGRRLVTTYGRFLGLTLLNPTTVVYFAALVLALPVLAAEPLARPAFVVGAFLASLTWQTALAALGAIAHHRLPAGVQVRISVLGNLMICGFAVVLARSLISS